METTKEISRSIFVTIEEIKRKYRNSKKIRYLDDTDSMLRKTHKLEGRELAELNSKSYVKRRTVFNRIVRDTCKRHGRNEDHIRRIAGWKRGRNITNIQLNDKD